MIAFSRNVLEIFPRPDDAGNRWSAAEGDRDASFSKETKHDDMLCSRCIRAAGLKDGRIATFHEPGLTSGVHAHRPRPRYGWSSVALFLLQLLAGVACFRIWTNPRAVKKGPCCYFYIALCKAPRSKCCGTCCCLHARHFRSR